MGSVTKTEHKRKHDLPVINVITSVAQTRRATPLWPGQRLLRILARLHSFRDAWPDTRVRRARAAQRTQARRPCARPRRTHPLLLRRGLHRRRRGVDHRHLPKGRPALARSAHRDRPSSVARRDLRRRPRECLAVALLQERRGEVLFVREVVVRYGFV